MEIYMGDIPLSVVIIGVVQLAKSVGFPGKYAGVLAVGLGLVLGVIMDPSVPGAIRGVSMGLMASGMWSATKSAVTP